MMISVVLSRFFLTLKVYVKFLAVVVCFHTSVLYLHLSGGLERSSFHTKLHIVM